MVIKITVDLGWRRGSNASYPIFDSWRTLAADDKEPYLLHKPSHLAFVQQPQALPSMSSNPDVPPFTGYVETTVNALRLIHAARQGVIPRITRRLNDAERRTMIKSGAVFVFSVEESGIKRWTGVWLSSKQSCMANLVSDHQLRWPPLVAIPNRGQLSCRLCCCNVRDRELIQV